MRTKHTFRLPPDLAVKLADYATRKRVPQALIVETALASFLSPDAAERLDTLSYGRRRGDGDAGVRLRHIDALDECLHGHQHWPASRSEIVKRASSFPLWELGMFKRHLLIAQGRT